MSTAEPAGLFDQTIDIRDIGEILYVVNSLVDVCLSPIALHEQIESYAGVSIAPPNAPRLMSLARSLSLVQQDADGYRNTALGRRIALMPKVAPGRLSAEQGLAILEDVLGFADAREAIELCMMGFSRTRPEDDWSIPESAPRGTAESRALGLLQQLGLVTQAAPYYMVSNTSWRQLVNLLDWQSAFSEDERRRRSAAQIERSLQAELYVLEFERRRLTDAGRPELADAVRHVSPVHCGAGYDVLSYDADGMPRYVEVKSALQRRVRFSWSIGQRSFAGAKGRRYWVYFVPMTAAGPDPDTRMFLIQNPVAVIPRLLVETPRNFYVEALPGLELSCNSASSAGRDVWALSSA